MKRIFLTVLSVILISSLFSCGSTKTDTKNEFTPLSDNEVLTVGQQQVRFMNYRYETTSVTSLTHVISATYTLNRSRYDDYNSTYIKYGDYYYYWTSDITHKTEELGNKSVTTIYTYEYLPYLENEGVDVKSIVETKTSFDYEGGWIEKNVDVEILLNGYFESFASLTNECPELAKKIDTRTTRRYFVDVTVPSTISTQHQFFDSYYYIEKK